MSGTDDTKSSPEPAPEPESEPETEAEPDTQALDQKDDLVDVELGDDSVITADDIQALIGEKEDTLSVQDRTLSATNTDVIEALREDMRKQAIALAELEQKHQYEQLHRAHRSTSDDSSSVSGCSPRSSMSSSEKAEKKKRKREEKAKKIAREEEKQRKKQEAIVEQNRSRKFDNFIMWTRSEKFKPDDKDKNKWSTLTRYRFQRCLWKLKYNRIVSIFYLDNLKRREGRWSWMIIVISTITSGLTVANNVEEEPVNNYNTYINGMLTVSSMTVSLIAAWIKKQMFIERINEADKYLLNINALCEDLEIQFALLNRDRIKYEDFKKKYIPEITKHLQTNPMIPPNEWKSCIREITLKYPELVNPDNTEENKLWPWFGDYVLDTDDYDTEAIVRNPTTFMEHFKKTNADRLKSSCCAGICKPKEITNVY